MGKSSKDKRDIYYRLAKEQGYRARSAFKLLQLDEHYRLFTPSTTHVLDLCAAPGSWSQVITQKLTHFDRLANEESDGDCGRRERRGPWKLVSVDLQPMAPIPGAIMVQADITVPSTTSLLHSLFSPPPPSPHAPHDSNPPDSHSLAREGERKREKDDAYGHVDLILTDGAPDVTGLHDLDNSLHLHLLLSSLHLCHSLLRRHGTFVAKIFGGGDEALLRQVAEVVFERVTVRKPGASRVGSMESFIICEGFFRPEELDHDGGEGGGGGGVQESKSDRVSGGGGGGGVVSGREKKGLRDFLAVGDLSMYDDMPIRRI